MPIKCLVLQLRGNPAELLLSHTLSPLGKSVEAVPSPDTLHILKQGRFAAAHQLHGPRVVLCAQRADDLDGIRFAKGDIEKDDIGVAMLVEGCHCICRRMEALDDKPPRSRA